MVEPKRAFYNMLDVLHFGPIDPKHLARWIESRMEGAGVAAHGVGAYIAELAGPRTRDSYTFDNPFLRGWVVSHALPDVGLHYPITYRPVGA